MFIELYNAIWLFEGKRKADTASGENYFDTPALVVVKSYGNVNPFQWPQGLQMSFINLN